MRPRLADFATTTERRSSEDTAAQWLQQAQHRGTAFTGEAGRGSLQRALWWRGDATPLAGYAAGRLCLRIRRPHGCMTRMGVTAARHRGAGRWRSTAGGAEHTLAKAPLVQALWDDRGRILQPCGQQTGQAGGVTGPTAA